MKVEFDKSYFNTTEGRTHSDDSYVNTTKGNLNDLMDTDKGAPLIEEYDTNPHTFFLNRTFQVFPTDGMFVRYWKNGNKRYEWEYKDGVRVDGISKAWYPDGKKKSEYTYKNGVLDGLYMEWFDNGQRMSRGTYKESRCLELTHWYRNGKKNNEGNT